MVKPYCENCGKHRGSYHKCCEQNRKTVSLDDTQTSVKVDPDRRTLAVDVAHRITLSVHEHEWTLNEQQAMAEFWG